MSGVSRSPSGGDRTEAPGASHDSRSKGVRACHPFRAIVAAVPFRRVRRARPVAIQPCPTPCRLRVAGTSIAPELRDRAESMLLGEGERPRASGMHPAAAQATNGLVLDLRHAVAQLWASSADAVKAACGPHVPTGLVDEIDVLAWLTADVLGRPLLTPPPLPSPPPRPRRRRSRPRLHRCRSRCLRLRTSTTAFASTPSPQQL